MLGHRRVVVGPLLDIAAEDIGPGHGDLLAPPLDLLLPVGRTLLLDPPERPAHFRLDGAQGPERILAVKRQGDPKALQLIDRMDRGLRAHGRRSRRQVRDRDSPRTTWTCLHERAYQTL